MKEIFQNMTQFYFSKVLYIVVGIVHTDFMSILELSIL